MNRKRMFKDEEDVKKWLRSIPLKKKELMLKIDFYAELKAGLELRRARLERENGETGGAVEKIVNTRFYENQIAALRSEMDGAAAEFERLTEPLEGIEKTILTMRYLRKMSWTAIAVQTVRHSGYLKKQSKKSRRRRKVKMNKTRRKKAANDAFEKINSLMDCGNERIELAAAKEILEMSEKADIGDEKVTVTIKVVGE